MDHTQLVYLVVFILWLITSAQGASALWEGVRFYRYVRRSVRTAGDLKDANGRFRSQPKAVIVLPCCGVDEELALTIAALRRQNYDDYEIIFTFESAEDPAYSAIREWTAEWDRPKCRFVTSGRATIRSQKIHNQLAAIEVIPPDCEALVMLDSDAVPHEDWLGNIVAPLAEPGVAAATGYRWYRAVGGLACGMRAAWNAATVTYLNDERVNFCWGGSTAILLETFRRIEVPRYWDRGAADDMLLTRAIRDAGMRIRFVPQALIPSADGISLRNFWIFARRQVLLTRFGRPRLWWSGLTLCANFVLGGTATAVLFFAALFGWFGEPRAAWFAFAGWMSILALAAGKAVARQYALRWVLPRDRLSRADFWWDVAGTLAFSGPLHLSLLFASTLSRRFSWRNAVYEIVSAAEIRIISRA